MASTAHPPGDQRIGQWRRSFTAAGWEVDVRCAELTGHLERIRGAGSMIAELRGQSFDAVVLVDPELIALGPLLRIDPRRSGRPAVVADVHEDFTAVAGDHAAWTGSVRQRAGSLGGRAVQVAAARCDAVVVADAHVPPRNGVWRLVGRNQLDAALVSHSSVSKHRTGELRRAVYAGDLTLQRGVQTMVDAVIDSPGWSLDLFGPERAAAMQIIEQAGRASHGRIRWRGHLPHEELVAHLDAYHVGLCVLDVIPTYAAAMPSKIIEYQSAGLAVVVSNLPRAAAAVRDSGSGVVLDGPGGHREQLVRALAALSDSARLAELGARGRAAFDRLDRSESLATAASRIAAAWRTDRPGLAGR